MIPPCSETELENLRSFAAAAQEAGYAVDLEGFGSRPSSEPWLAAYAGLAVVAAMLVYVVPLLSAVVGAAAVVLHARESEGRPLLRRRSCTGLNAVARAPAARRPVLVIVASAEAVPPRLFERTQRAVTVALQGSMVAVAGGGAAAWVAEAEAELPLFVLAIATAAAAAIAVLAIVLYASGRAPGRSGGTLGVLTDLAPELRDEPVWLLGSGGRRGGMAGIQAFVAAHPETSGAWWLNLEPGSLAQGVCAVSEEGTWRERRADRFLLGAAEEAGARVRPYRAAATDATALLARRRRALTLIVGGRGNVATISETIRAALDASPRSRRTRG